MGAAVCGFYAAAAVSAAFVEDEPSPKHIGTVYDRGDPPSTAVLPIYPGG